MSTVLETAPPRRVPLRQGATVAVLAVSLAAGLLIHWGVAVMLLVLGLAILHQPFDLLFACVLIAITTPFANYDGGQLTRELGAVTLLILYALACLAIGVRLGRWHWPRSGLTPALALLGVTTALSVVNGLLARHSLRFLGLELLPNLGFFIAPMLGGVATTSRGRQVALSLLVVAALADVLLGFQAYAVNHQRIGGVYFTDNPGLVALILLNLALRTEDRRARWGMLILMGAMILHQVISFTRGYWFGLVAGVMLSFVMYGGRSRERWGRIARLSAGGALVSLASLVTFGSWFGYGDIFVMIGQRLASSFSVGGSEGTISNFARVVEYTAALRSIAASPWFGHGLGFELLVRQPIYGIITSQWYLHQSYLLMWLNQGVFGLIALVWLLFAGVRLGVAGARTLPAEEAGWNAAAASCTLSVAVIALTNFVFATVTTNFVIALLWGIALSTSAHRENARAPAPGRDAMLARGRAL